MKIGKALETIIKADGYSDLTGKLKDGSSTLLELFENKVSNSPDYGIFGAINGENKIEYMTYKQADFCSRKLGNYFSTITTLRDVIGIASVNRPECLIAEYATYYANCINSSININFDENALGYTLFLTKMEVLVVSSHLAKSIIKKIEDSPLKKHIKLKNIVLMDHDEKIMEICKKAGYVVTSFSEIIFGNQISSANPQNSNNLENEYFSTETTIVKKVSKYFNETKDNYKHPEMLRKNTPKPGDIASYCFTSGTSGSPKGVKLTHSNFIYQIEGFCLGSEKYHLFEALPSDVYMSYLPLSHVLERLCVCICMFKNSKIGFYCGKKENFSKDLKTISPSFLPTVPLVLKKFYENIEKEVSALSFYKRCIFRAALNIKMKLQKIGIFKIKIIDNIIFSKVVKSFGGNLRACLCGGASIDPYLIEYLQAVLNIKIFQGYGQTETLGASMLNRMNDNSSSSIGYLFPTTVAKLVSLSESVQTKECHLLLRGHSITSGYLQPTMEDYTILDKIEGYKNLREKLSESIFDKDGFLITGDIVIFKDKKFFYHTRSSESLKLDNGEYISLTNIEDLMTTKCKFEEVYLTKSQNNMGLVAIIGIKDAVTDKKSIISDFNTIYSKLVEDNAICSHIKVDFINVLENYDKNSHPEFYTEKGNKKRHVMNLDNVIIDMIKNAIPNENNNTLPQQSIFEKFWSKLLQFFHKKSSNIDESLKSK